jgi:hypothetical protein
MRHDHYCHVYPVLPPEDCNVLATRPIFKACLEGKQRKGLMPHQWWWEQPMCLDAIDAIGFDANDGQLDAPTPVDA